MGDGTDRGFTGGVRTAYPPQPAMRSPFAPGNGRDHADGGEVADDSELTLPAAWTPPARPPIPLAAAAVPVVGAVVLWLVTGSMLALLLAALGPLVAIATTLDARRGARRDRRRAAEEAAEARGRVAAAVSRRQAAEQRRRWARHPDVATLVSRDDAVWRATTTGAALALVVGRGEAASGIRVQGGGNDADASALRATAARLPEAPITVPLAGTVAVVGAGAAADAVHRALVTQVCLLVPPGELRLVGAVVPGEEWIERMPHRRAVAGLAVSVGGWDPRADAGIVRVPPDAALPPGSRCVLTVRDPARSSVEMEGDTVQIAVEAIGRAQAEAIAEMLSLRARSTLGEPDDADEATVLPALLEPLVREGAGQDGDAAVPTWRDARRPSGSTGATGADDSRPQGLVAAIGGRPGAPVVVDLVADGPHAVVAGVTGSGKSELLITWVAALAATHSTEEVSFLLSDFKGGTAFDALSGLPHVTGVITDLDGAGARRAIESLRAEVRWRESELARCGARDIRDARVRMPRLVVVVDEFAALLGETPELHAVFSDVAARGRALGLHLVLGTQRVSGVVREGLLANCPLRISLRVTDAGDSRAVLGTDEAALLPGGAAGRGMALVRRAGDTTPERTRIALTPPDYLAELCRRDAGPVPRRPWLPALAARITLDEVLARPDAPDHALVLGLADEPDAQRQRTVALGRAERGLMIVGGPGSGKSIALRTLASQAGDRLVDVPADAEAAWDAIATLAVEPPADGVVVIDDLDVLVTRFPHDHGQELLDRLERIFRSAGGVGTLVVATAQRLTGSAARLADLLPQRLVLATRSRSDHVALGGEPGEFLADLPPGRGRWRGLAVQVAVSDATGPAVRSPRTDWWPSLPLTGFVSRTSPAARAALADWRSRGIRVLSLEEYAADPSVTAEGAVVVTGEPDDWQRHWRLLSSVRSDHDLLIDTSCGSDYRMLTGSRALPPFAESGRGRAWLLRAGAEAVRIVLPAGDVRSDRHRAAS